MVSERLLRRMTCPNHASFRLLTVARRSSCGPTRKLIILLTQSLVVCSKHDVRRSFIRHSLNLMDAVESSLSSIQGAGGGGKENPLKTKKQNLTKQGEKRKHHDLNASNCVRLFGFEPDSEVARPSCYPNYSTRQSAIENKRHTVKQICLHG